MNPAVQCVRRCDCGQQSTSQPQPTSTGLIGYGAVGTSEVNRPGTCRGPRVNPGASAVSSDAWRGSGALQVVADVLEDLAHDRAQEEQGHDHDDRDEGQEQTVLNQSLAVLFLASELGEKSADELKHSLRYLLSFGIGVGSVEVPRAV